MLNVLLPVHQLVGWLILAVGTLSFLLGGAWLLMRRGAAPDANDSLRRAFRYGLIGTTALGGLQALLGVGLVVAGGQPGNGLHYVYGGLVLLLIPIAWVYSDQNQVRRDAIIMVIAAVLVVGAGARALMTGPLAH
ncbi:MAG TPA: hypothetical protein VF807_12815 [Ktedonobacterales bacterium]